MHFQDTDSLYRTKDPAHFHLKEFIDKTSRVEGFSEVRHMLYKRDTHVSILAPWNLNKSGEEENRLKKIKSSSLCYK